MTTFYDRFHCPNQSQDLPNAQLLAFNEQIQHAQRYRVYQSGNGLYQVEHPDTGVKYIVDLTKRPANAQTSRNINHHVHMELQLANMPLLTLLRNFRSTKAGGIEIGSLSEHQNYNLENVHITTATLIKFTQKIIY